MRTRLKRRSRERARCILRLVLYSPSDPGVELPETSENLRLLREGEVKSRNNGPHYNARWYRDVRHLFGVV